MTRRNRRSCPGHHFRSHAPFLGFLPVVMMLSPVAAMAQNIGDSCAALGKTLMTTDRQNLIACMETGQTEKDGSPALIYKDMTGMANNTAPMIYAMGCISEAGASQTFVSPPISLGGSAANWLETAAPSGLSTWLVQFNLTTGSPITELNCFNAGAGSPSFTNNTDCIQYSTMTGGTLDGRGKDLKTCSNAVALAVLPVPPVLLPPSSYNMTCTSAAGRSKTFSSPLISIGGSAANWLETAAPSGLGTWLVQFNLTTGAPLTELNCYDAGASSPNQSFTNNADCIQYSKATGGTLDGAGANLATCSNALTGAAPPPPPVSPPPSSYEMTCTSKAGNTKTFTSPAISIGGSAADWLATAAPSGLGTWLVKFDPNDGHARTKLNCYDAGAGSPNQSFTNNADCIQYSTATGGTLDGAGADLKSCSKAQAM